MGLFNLIFRKKNANPNKKGKAYKRFGFGKKIFFKTVPCRYIHTQGNQDVFLREDRNTLVAFSREYVDALVTTQAIENKRKVKSLKKV